jgi:glutamate synthase domain-containing protein 3
VCEGAGKYAFEFMTGGVGVLLGPNGGQVACGMTGGVVYILDRDGEGRASVCRDACVEPLTGSDAERLQRLVAAFAEATGSPVGQQVLAQWQSDQACFVKVTPGA